MYMYIYIHVYGNIYQGEVLYNIKTVQSLFEATLVLSHLNEDEEAEN